MRVKLEEVCERGSSNLKQSDIIDQTGEFPIYGASGYIGNVGFYHQDKPYVAVVKDGAGIGRAMLLPAKSSVIGTMQYLLPKDNIVPKYLYYVVKHMHLEKYFSGATIPHIYFRDYKNEEFNCESFEKQNEIVTVLEKTENIISARKQQLQQLDELVKARFVEMFGLPVSNSKRWNTEKMSDVAPAVNYLGDFDEMVWLLNLDMVESQTGRIIDFLYISKNEVSNSTCTFDTTNVLYSKLRPYLNKVVIPDRCGYATSEMIPLKPNSSKMERAYLAYMLRSNEFVSMINEKVAGAKMPRVSMSDFRAFDVPVPPIELQSQFSDFVEQVDKSKFVCLTSMAIYNKLFHNHNFTGVIL